MTVTAGFAWQYDVLIDNTLKTGLRATELEQVITRGLGRRAPTWVPVTHGLGAGMVVTSPSISC